MGDTDEVRRDIFVSRFVRGFRTTLSGQNVIESRLVMANIVVTAEAQVKEKGRA
jgi:hypothetical protein